LFAPADTVEVTFRRKIKKISESFEAIWDGEKVIMIGEDGENALCATVFGHVLSMPADELPDLEFPGRLIVPPSQLNKEIFRTQDQHNVKTQLQTWSRMYLFAVSA
jgi:hypothetical protein